jgi:hypothetical protein
MANRRAALGLLMIIFEDVASFTCTGAGTETAGPCSGEVSP